MSFTNIKLSRIFVAFAMLTSVTLAGLALTAPKAEAITSPSVPTFKDSESCEGGGTYIIPKKLLRVYKINGTKVSSGTYSAEPGSTVNINTYGSVTGRHYKDESRSHTFPPYTCPTSEVITPEEVTFTSPTCEGVKGTYTIPSAELVYYFLEGSDATLEPGTYDAGTDSTISIYAQPIGEEYYFEEGATTEWTYTFELGDCTLPAVDDTPQVTVKPTGSVDAGAGSALAAIAGLLSSVGLVSAGVVLKKKSL